MARVYRAHDTVLGRDVALKELEAPAAANDREAFTTLFEREFRTLSQLRHPRVIAVYDYGVGSSGPYYTMELLDGGDLRDRAPIPWRQACALLFDVCSSLALLHSRRLVHRDITPRNVRCTHDGKAKLIDFGAMVAMTSGGAPIVGTPAFTAPETVHRLALDARADLFSLGATFYSALTGQLAFPARTFAEALAAWNEKPLPPSALVADIPAALDELVLSLLCIEPSLRPSSAFDVMQRLAAIAGLTRDESAEVSAAYLATPKLVGREGLLETLRARLFGAQHGRSGGILIRADPGLGRSRVLDACVLDAKTQGSTVLRAAASGDPTPFAVARALVEHLLAAVPAEGLLQLYPELFERAPGVSGRVTLRSFAAGELESVQRALSRLILTVSRGLPLLLAIDDVHRIDPASAAVVATLLDKAARGKWFIALTAEAGADTPSVEVLARRCETLALEPLTLEQLQKLFSSLFGDVANVDAVAREIHAVALGNPRHSMDIAQHLVDRGLIRYAAGIWILPSQLSAADLPHSAEAALREKLAGASREAQWLARAHALAYEDLLTDAQYRALRPEADARSTDDAVSELLVLGAITRAGSAYVLSNRVWAAALRAGLPAETERTLHRALADMYEPESPLGLVYHAFASGDELRGLGAFAARIKDERVDPKVLDGNLSKLVPAYRQALDAAVRHRRPPRELANIRRWSVALSIATDGELYSDAAHGWFEQLRHGSGLDLWQADREAAPGERLLGALGRANERYLATPADARVYSVEEAIRLLAEYVVMSIVIGGRVLDMDLLASLPGVLEPFAPLSPVLDAIWHNAIASAEAQCENRLDAARERWCGVLQRLDALPAHELMHIEAVRNAVAFALGMTDAQLGLPSALTYTERLDGDPFQKLSALHLRKIVRLTQGDWAGADRLRREAEVLGLHLHSLQMFKIVLFLEVNVYSKARDLSGLRQAIELARPIAAKWPAWDVYVRDAEAYFDMVRGDLAAARRGFEQGVKRTAFGPNGRSPAMAVWLTCRVGLAEVLLELGEAEASRALAREAVDTCDRLNLGTAASCDLQRALALAEAACGDFGPAAQRLERMIEAQTRAGAAGLPLGLNYEARARIAIWGKDRAAFEEFSRSAAREYRRGAQSPLGVRYERLVNEAARSGFQASAGLGDFQPATMLETGVTGSSHLHTIVVRAMLGAGRTEERAERALGLLCEAFAAPAGHLFLMNAERPQLAASHGAAGDAAGLVETVHDFVVDTQARSEERTMLVGADGAPPELTPATTARAAGVEYDLLLLTHVAAGAGLVAGVAALARSQNEHRGPFAQQTQLLQALAAHLVQAGDVTGRFEVS